MSEERPRRQKRKENKEKDKDKDLKHLNWLQERILELLFEQKDLYGQEIADILLYKYKDEEKIRSGQLYPALRKLEKGGFVKSEEKSILNIKHVIYSILEKGEAEIHRQFSTFFHLMEVRIGKNLGIILDNLKNNVDFSDKICVDLSNRFLDPVTLKLANFVKPDGRYFIRKDSYFNPELSELLQKRIETFNHQHVITLKDRDEFSSKNVDIVLAVFTLHESDTAWILSKMKEILRPEGYGVIIDLVGLEGHIIEKIVADYLTNHQSIGLDVNEIKERLSKLRFSIINESVIDGIVTLIFQPEN